MTGFSPAWLELREPADRRARSAGLVRRLAKSVVTDPIELIDLGTGTGANLRYMAPRLGRAQRWRLLDHDSAVLDALPDRLTDWARSQGIDARADTDGLTFASGARALQVEARAESCDLATGLKSLKIGAGAVVTASALLDLVSLPWLEQLASHCAAARAAVLFALTYDGRIELKPGDPDDARIVDLVNRHQRGDKGFGPALGPGAADAAMSCFEQHGYRAMRVTSDWTLGAESVPLADELLDGLARAATELALEDATAIEAWRTRRLALCRAGALEVTVGHTDLLLQPD